MGKETITTARGYLLVAVVCCLLIFLFSPSCKKEYSCENCFPGSTNATNKPPLAKAGADQIITLPKDSVAVDGSASLDPDGSISNYAWTKVSGPASFVIINSSSSITTVKNLTAGTYRFELKVTDNGGLTARDTVGIVVDSVQPSNHPPVANAGIDQTITLPTNAVNLDGSASTDPENNITSYAWTKISGPSSFTIVNLNAAQTQVTNLAQGTYQFELKVTDAGGLFSKDTMQIFVNAMITSSCDNRPVINAILVPVGTLSQSRGAMAVGAAGNKIVFAGGLNVNDGSSRVDIYDVVTNSWSTATLSVPRYEIAATSAGNKIFFAGGLNTDVYPNIDVYDVSANTWSVMLLSEAKAAITAVSFGNKVYFAGGYKSGFQNSDKVEIYDMSSNTWTVATLSEARSWMAGTVIGNEIFFAGGSKNGTGNFSNKIDIYNTTTNTWSTDVMAVPKTDMAGISVGVKNYWAGGNTGSSCSHVEIRDESTHTSAFAQLCYPRLTFDAVVKDNKIVFFTGYPCSNGANAYNRFEIYNITTNTWAIGTLPIDLINASIISYNNIIYVAGETTLNGVSASQLWKLEF